MVPVPDPDSTNVWWVSQYNRHQELSRYLISSHNSPHLQRGKLWHIRVKHFSSSHKLVSDRASIWTSSFFWCGFSALSTLDSPHLTAFRLGVWEAQTWSQLPLHPSQTASPSFRITPLFLWAVLLVGSHCGYPRARESWCQPWEWKHNFSRLGAESVPREGNKMILSKRKIESPNATS